MQKEEKNFRSYYDEAEEESHDYFDINDCYDYEGNLVDHNIEVQCPVLERIFSPNVEFDMESCKQGKYTFDYLYS